MGEQGTHYGLLLGPLFLTTCLGLGLGDETMRLLQSTHCSLRTSWMEARSP